MKLYDYYITPEEYKIAEQNGICKTTLESRIRRLGWDKEKALTEPCRERNDYSYWYNIAQQNGIGKTTFFSRIRLSNWDLEKAATTPVMERKKINRVYPDYVYDTLEQNGISLGTFRTRIRRGWSLEDAMNKPVMKKSEVMKRMQEASKNVRSPFWEGRGC